MRAIHDVPAPAKLNLFLHIVGRREDGYHLLQSVFVLLDCCDTLHLERRDDGRLQRHDLGPPLPPDDLTLRAARALQAASATRLGADLHVLKRIPAGAGLGGGSSDAASTLLALNRLWGLNWPRARLTALGATLGADVPFFIGGTPAWVEGVGERLTPLVLPPMRFELLKPPGALHTADVFAHPMLERASNPATISDFLKTASGDQPAGLFGRNDMQAAARALCPDVGVAVDELVMRHGNGRMTGSGSAVFALLPPAVAADAGYQEEQEEAGAHRAAAGPTGWWRRRCASLAVHPLADWPADGAPEVVGGLRPPAQAGGNRSPV